jgi:hypothetical protein
MARLGRELEILRVVVSAPQDDQVLQPPSDEQLFVADDKPMREVHLESHLALCRYICRSWRPQGVAETRYYIEVRAMITKRDRPGHLTQMKSSPTGSGPCR